MADLQMETLEPQVCTGQTKTVMQSVVSFVL